jgi:hypothetical protein
VVLSVVGGKDLLKYADGIVTSVNVRNWQRIRPKSTDY